MEEYDIIVLSNRKVFKFMNSTTWSIRMPKELKERKMQHMREIGLLVTDLIPDIEHIYELNKTREVLPSVEVYIQGL